MTIIDQVKTKCNKESVFRVGFIGYKDFENKFEKEHFCILDYTEDIEVVKDKIKSCKADSTYIKNRTLRDDVTEDVIGALKESLKLNHKS